MKFANATRFNRKSGVARWRDPRYASTANECHLEAPPYGCSLGPKRT
jgi:hypothetical protein